MEKASRQHLRLLLKVSFVTIKETKKVGRERPIGNLRNRTFGGVGATKKNLIGREGGNNRIGP